MIKTVGDLKKALEVFDPSTPIKLTANPIMRIKKKCLCCGKEMELLPYEERDFCDSCFPIVCREVFNKANDELTVKEVKERIRRNIEK